MAELDGGLLEQEQRWRERLTHNGEALFGENEELLMSWNGDATEAGVEAYVVDVWDEPAATMEPK